MKYGIIEGFEMHRTKEAFGIPSDGDREALLEKARALGFNGVEFGVGHDFEQDAFWTGEGTVRRAIKKASEDTGVEIPSVCLHMLNDVNNSPASCETADRERGRSIILKTIEACSEVGIPLILLPFFGSAALREEEKITHLIDSMKKLAPIAKENNIFLGLETSLGAPDMVRIVDAIGSENVKVYFDTGNADIIGYNIITEIEVLSHRIVQVHMKDNPSGLLGKGRIDFSAVCEALAIIEYDGYMVCETPALDDAIVSARSNLEYMMSTVDALKQQRGSGINL